MPSERFAFIVRIWLEESSPSPDSSRLRGSVQTAITNEAHYFTSLDDLPCLLRELASLKTASGQDQQRTDC
jgi:hypothetical protein